MPVFVWLTEGRSARDLAQAASSEKKISRVSTMRFEGDGFGKKGKGKDEKGKGKEKDSAGKGKGDKGEEKGKGYDKGKREPSKDGKGKGKDAKNRSSILPPKEVK